ncbi:MAG: SDR family NAD(P)-dependent oxidoreductase [Myxococcota bacterium]|nr:SDR family NAD(P)-dependent oxidoreductase [Myxococcota bacterium]
MSIELKGRTVVVTGASRGLGAAMAEFAAGQGMNLGLCSRGPSALAESDSILVEQLDVTDETAVAEFAGAVASRFGAIDLWINNAGMIRPIDPVRSLSIDEFRRHVDVNLIGVLIGCQTFIRHRAEQGGGGVLLNLSTGAPPFEGWSAYCSSKAAVDRLTEVVAAEEGKTGLRAHAVAPGIIDTAMHEEIRACPPERFPAVGDFIEMKTEDSFSSAAFVARELFALAFDPARAEQAVRVAFPAESDGEGASA